MHDDAIRPRKRYPKRPIRCSVCNKRTTRGYLTDYDPDTTLCKRCEIDQRDKD